MRLESYTYNEYTIYENDLIIDNEETLIMVRLIYIVDDITYVANNNSKGEFNITEANDFINQYNTYFDTKVTIPPYDGSNEILPTPTPTQTESIEPTPTPTPTQIETETFSESNSEEPYGETIFAYIPNN